ncbi:NAD(P)-binding Rossmann-like domain-containing protein [Methanobrevibacter gottschalkii]|uniref:NAD(P)-binding Rossmann-like domain-containing protein n=2 Tax=Methanobrevibacter gottschalkii TaxID=190974 RepID=A0A1H7J357_9EURY|nr:MULTISPECIES: GMC family oxidoreductase N-terminal domain-containing protein [Methanobrevibacter]MCQ2970961.1 GMC family oxidoreductase N-terminal domain-containing protein [archaeon]OEC98519.1 ferredoxin [Methanobrevibacter sp. A27]RPF51498.1 putative NAD(P)-binding protein [Methanobrevibacter gottschalkii DSM 11977]SEK68834.1 NAD(P)-binding Rossmann-like domain-containing protein [Methanobrevibacter gottschalkii]
MIVIVGTGAGGGILAREIAKEGIDVTILEKGPYIHSKDAFNYYDTYSGDVDLLTTTCIGGSTIVSMSNMVRALDDELLDYDIDLSDAYEYVEDLINVHPIDDSHIGKGTKAFLDAGNELGLQTMKMPKAIREEECIQCGKCAFGCPVDAKFSGKDFIDEAVEYGAALICEADVREVTSNDGVVYGVKYIKDGKEEIIKADKVVLSAGAIGSTLILRKSGISKAGREIFFDPFVSVGGYLKDVNFNSEVQMAGLIIGKNFVLAPHYSSFIPGNIDDDSVTENDILSIMVKTSDECKGYVTDDGDVVKINTIQDIRYLAEGTATAGFVLERAGVDPNTIGSTVYRGAHPGGTAKIGEIVNSNLETEIDNLFVCDASVLPISPGKPPILTILALSKRLADYLKN